MTIINCLRQSHSVHLFSDALAYSPSGAFRTCHKLYALPGLPAIVGVRGPMIIGPFVAEVLGLAQSYDDVKDAIAIILQAHLPQIADMFSGSGFLPNTEFEVVVGGISQRTGRPDSFFMATHGRYGKTPWEIWDPGVLLIGPLNDATDAACASLFQRQMLEALRDGLDEQGAYDRLEPAVDGLRIVEIQREFWNYGDNQRAGGFLQIMSLDVDGSISTRILRRWPDDAIDPGSVPRIEMPPLTPAAA